MKKDILVSHARDGVNIDGEHGHLFVAWFYLPCWDIQTAARRIPLTLLSPFMVKRRNNEGDERRQSGFIAL